MSEQLKDKCPICGSYLFSDDDIVHCPDCGAPHHRDCYLSRGSCGRDHTIPYERNTESAENDTSATCKFCNKALPKDTNFCPYCGKTQSNGNPNFPFNNGAFPNGMPVMFKTAAENPLGSVDKDEKFDGVNAGLISKFIGPNSIRILPIFKRMKQTGKKTNWNFIAFISPQSHAMFRKMNIASYVYTLLEIIAYVLLSPLFFAFEGTKVAETGSISNMFFEFIKEPLKYATPLSVILGVAGIIIFVGMRIFAGLYNDYLYKNHIVNTIKKIQKESEDEEYDFAKKGGARPIISLLMFMFFLYFGTFLPSFFGGLLLS